MERGVEISFEVGDVESLPYDDATFDVASSSVGAIFAPDHARTAEELGRVSKPGGRLVLTAWTAEGRIGDFFRLIASYSPPPVDGAGVPMQWGDAAYCEAMLGPHFDSRSSRSTRPGSERPGRRCGTSSARRSGRS